MARLASMLLCVLMSVAGMAGDAGPLHAAGLLPAGSEAPDFTLCTMDGREFSLSSLRGGYVVLDFWASWCPDCRRDVPAMKRLNGLYGHVATFVGVSFDERREAWESYVTKSGMGWLQVSELRPWKETEVSRLYGIEWIPSMVLVDPRGMVILSTVTIDELEAKLKELTEQ